MNKVIVVNCAWHGQRTTGQQRYAGEISSRLLSHPDVVGRPDRTARNRWLAWAGVQLLSFPRSRDEILLTLTSRGPLWHPRHVVVIHDHFVLTHPEWYSPLYVRSHAATLRTQIKTAKALVFVSEATRDTHRELFGLQVPFAVVPNGVRPSGDAEQYIRPREKPYLLAVASSDPRKNLTRLVTAYASLPYNLREECQLLLVGAEESLIFGQNGVSTDLVGGVAKMGYVDDDELWRLYRGARAVVVPSLNEGFGLPLVEAASMGAPLLVSEIPVFRWIAQDDAIYFDPYDQTSISSALRFAIENPHNLPVMDQVNERYSWDASAEILIGFLRDLQGT